MEVLRDDEDVLLWGVIHSVFDLRVFFALKKGPGAFNHSENYF